MSKVKYDEFDDEMNPLHPCLKCGATGFSMNWDTGLYQCDSCGAVLEIDESEKNKKEGKLIIEEYKTKRGKRS